MGLAVGPEQSFEEGKPWQGIGAWGVWDSGGEGEEERLRILERRTQIRLHALKL